MRRLTRQVKVRHASLEQARLERMTDEEFLAHVGRLAIMGGCLPDQAFADLDAAGLWLEEKLRAELEALPSSA